MANLVFDFLHNYHAGERRDSEPANAYQYDEGHVIEAVVPVVVTSCEIHYWIRGMEKAEAYVPDSITPNADGTCTILGHVPNEYFQTNGELRVYIVVTDGDASLTTYEGKIQVCQRSMPDDYVDDDPDNEATRVLTEAREAAATATAAAETCEEVRESIPEDYSQLSDDVEDLKDGLLNTTSFNSWQKGTFDATGAISATGNGAVSSTQPINNTTVVHCESGSRFVLAFYDSNRSYIGKVGANGSINKTSGDWKFFTEDTEVNDYAPDNAKYFLICLLPTDGTTITADTATQWANNHSSISETVFEDISMRLDDLATETQDDINSICEYIEFDLNQLSGGWQPGFWANWTGDYNPARTDYVCSVNGVEVVPAQTIYVKNIPYAGTVYLVPYKKDGSYNTDSNNVSQVISNHAVSFTVPSNTYYIKFDIISGGSGPNPMIPADYVDTVVSYTNYQDFSTTNNYVISRDFLKHPLNVTYKGHIKQMQAFCIYDEKYYSTDGSNISIQNADLTDVSTTSISTGHGNSFQIGSGSVAYISGWNDNKVYAVDLDNMTISDTITLPTTGYTTCAIDDVNKIAYIFQRDSVPDTEAYYNFIVYDYDNEQVLSTKKTTIKMAAMQDLDFVDGTIIVSYGLGTSSAPSGIVAFDTNGDVAFRYDIPLFTFELEGVAYNRQENRLEASIVSTSLYWITQK